MPSSKDLQKLSPIPTVDLSAIDVPLSGFSIQTPSICRKNFLKDDTCRTHYLKLRKAPLDVVQCPYGFATCCANAGGVPLAFTGFIPFPRLGGEEERRLAKSFPETKISMEGVKLVIQGIASMGREIEKAERDVAERYAMAFHEIRKLNRTVKQTAERLCFDEGKDNIDQANPSLLKIYKTAELMSYQFEILSFLANENLAELPLNTVSNVYQLFDKCVRIYKGTERCPPIFLQAPLGFSAKIGACDRTIPIIPTVLIDNASRHATKGSAINIDVASDTRTCSITVSNRSKIVEGLDERIFQKGYRANHEVEGSGNGLYIAFLVAKQHKAKISLSKDPINDTEQKVTFRIDFPTI